MDTLLTIIQNPSLLFGVVISESRLERKCFMIAYDSEGMDEIN